MVVLEVAEAVSRVAAPAVEVAELMRAETAVAAAGFVALTLTPLVEDKGVGAVAAVAPAPALVAPPTEVVAAA